MKSAPSMEGQAGKAGRNSLLFEGERQLTGIETPAAIGDDGDGGAVQIVGINRSLQEGVGVTAHEDVDAAGSDSQVLVGKLVFCGRFLPHVREANYIVTMLRTYKDA